MKLKSISILIILLLSLQLSQAQNFWEKIDVPDTADLQCIDVNQNGAIFLGTLKTYPTFVSFLVDISI